MASKPTYDELLLLLEEERRAREEERRRREELQAVLAPSSLSEYLGFVNEHLYKALQLQSLSSISKAASDAITSDTSTASSSRSAAKKKAAMAQGGTTKVDGKFYPERLREWAQFPQVHKEEFARLQAALGEKPLFPGLSDTKALGRDISPGPRDEQDVRPFIRAAIEKPATNIIREYLHLGQAVHGLHVTDIRFRNNAHGLGPVEDDAQPTNEDETEGEAADSAGVVAKSKTTGSGIPDRWCTVDYEDGSCRHWLVAEYKAAHKLPARKLNAVLGKLTDEDFFVSVIEEKSNETESASRSESRAASPSASQPSPGAGFSAMELPGDDTTRIARRASRSAVLRAQSRSQSRLRLPPNSVLVAKVLCQAYHYMLTSGLEFGYVTSGDALVFLRVLKDDPHTLYYASPSMMPSHATTGDSGERDGTHTAAAQLVSLIMCASKSSQRPRSWIDARRSDVARWPTPYSKFRTLSRQAVSDLPSRPHYTDDDESTGGGAGGAGGGGGGGNTRTGATGSGGGYTRAAPSTSSGRTTTTHGAPPLQILSEELPQVAYCTQACLLGLRNGLPLDKGCPNVTLHSAAADNDSDSHLIGKHPLTADTLCERLRFQLAWDMDSDCECLDKFGCFGVHGVLFRFTVTSYGYTLVGKAVRAKDRHVLEDEARIYKAFEDVQGQLIPVQLGIVDFATPLPLYTCTCVSHTMLMSYAGPTLVQDKLLPGNIDWDAETERTTKELLDLGLENCDIRPANLAWNAETQRVFELDFGNASFIEAESYWGSESENQQEPPEPENAPEQVPDSSSGCSPVTAKRHLNICYNDGGDPGESQMAKRAQLAL